MTEPAPSLSISSQRTLRACVSVSHTAPSPPPVSSSTVTTTSSSPRAGRQPSRASETAATTSAAVWDFMSTAPRPQTKPSTTSPDHGSRRQSPGSASTVSMCDARQSVGPSARPRSRATRLGRASVRPRSSTSKPAPESRLARYSCAARSLPGGLTVLQRISRCRTPVVACCRSAMPTDDPSQPLGGSPPVVTRASVGEVVRNWGRIGCIGFGGPPAHIALLRELCVDRRGWLDAREFEDANAAAGLLPGPASTQMAIFCAQRAGGLAGAVAGGLAFILPGLVLILVLAAISLQSRPPDWIRGLSAGAGAAVVAVVVRAGLELAGSSLRTRRGARLARAVAYVGVGAAAAVTMGGAVVVVLLACGLVELGLRRGGIALHAWPAALPLAASGAAALPALAWTAFKVGALSYGGGFVVIPLMHGDAVDANGWMTDAEFANAVAYGQLTPGPVVQTVAIVGWAAAGFGGALLAAAVAFAPSFAAIAAFGRRFVRVRRSAPARAFLDGAGPAAVGAILGAVVVLFGALEEAWQYAVLGAAAVLLGLSRPAFVVLVGGAV